MENMGNIGNMENIEKTTGKHGKIRGKYGISGSNVFGLTF